MPNKIDIDRLFGVETQTDTQRRFLHRIPGNGLGTYQAVVLYCTDFVVLPISGGFYSNILSPSWLVGDTPVSMMMMITVSNLDKLRVR